MRDSENVLYKALYFGKYLWDRWPGFYGELQEQNALNMGMDPEWAKLTGDYSSTLFLEGFTTITVNGVRAYKNIKTGEIIYDDSVVVGSRIGTTAKTKSSKLRSIWETYTGTKSTGEIHHGLPAEFKN
jgi:hypothetical protein